MSTITEMLNKIESWGYKNKNIFSSRVKPGLTKEKIDSIFNDSNLSKNSLKLPQEIYELYQWGNGGNSRFEPDRYCCAEYSFYNFEYAIQEGEEFYQYLQKNSRKEIKYIFPIVEEDGALIWTTLNQETTNLAPLYYNDELIMDSPNYPSLASMLESIMKYLKIN